MTLLLPHRNLNVEPTVIRVSEWQIEGKPVGDSVPWQPGLDLVLESDFYCDREAATSALGFDPYGSTSVVVEWISDSTRLRENCGRFPLSENVTISVTLPGDRIGGTLSLRRRLVTDDAVRSNDSFTPILPGSLLWEDRIDFRTEGGGPQFPVITTSFAGAGLPGNAAWAVRVPSPSTIIETDTFSEPASEHVCVRLNGDHPLATRLAANHNDDEVARLAVAQISCELARGLLGVALSEEFKVDDYLPGTLGALITTTLGLLGFGSVAEADRRDPEEIAAIVQDRFLVWDMT